jgi:hypothetical protein
MESRRDASNKSGVMACSRVFGGTRGPETGTIRAVGKCLGWVMKRVKISIRNVARRVAHWFICLCFCLACAELTRCGRDALGVSGRDARAKCGAVPGLLLLLLLLLLDGVVHAPLVILVEGVWLGLAVRRRALREPHAWGRVLREERRGRDVLREMRGGARSRFCRERREGGIRGWGTQGGRRGVAGTHDGRRGRGEEERSVCRERRGCGRRGALAGLTFGAERAFSERVGMGGGTRVVRHCSREGWAASRERDVGNGEGEGGFWARALLRVGIGFGACSPGVRHGSCSGEMREQKREMMKTAGGISHLYGYLF